MKKIIIVLIVISFVGCNDNNKKKTDTPITTADTSLLPIIDTTIIEDGVAPLADDNVMARKDKADKEEKQKKIKISCSWGEHKFNGNEKFNHKKRNLDEAKRAKPPRGRGHGGGGDTTVNPPPPINTSTNVVFLNFFGDSINNTAWNVNGLIVVGHSGLTQPEVDAILVEVQLHFPLYNIRITTDKAVFDSAAWGHKVQVDITEDYQWYGSAGGVAYLNSFFWTDHSPAFVFSSLLAYGVHNVAEAISHEAGHTLGLRHQSDCTNGVKTNEYSFGKVMGNSYGTYPTGPWWHGTNSLCADQDDDAMIAAAIGRKAMGAAYTARHIFSLVHQSYFLKPKNKI